MLGIVAVSILALATNTVPANAPQPATPPLPTLTCAGFGMKEVIIQDKGSSAVPVGTIVHWQLPPETHMVGGSNLYFAPASGFYEFAQTLSPGGSFALNAPLPEPASGGPGGPQPPPELVTLVMELFRGCNISYSSKSAMMGQQMQLHSMSAIAVSPATPTGVTVRRKDANTVLVTWAGGVGTDHFSVFETTTASSPPSNYHGWQNPATVANNVLQATLSTSAATKPQTNYYMVCAANAASSAMNCSSPAVESVSPYTVQHQTLVQPH